MGHPTGDEAQTQGWHHKMEKIGDEAQTHCWHHQIEKNGDKNQLLLTSPNGENGR